MLLKYYIQYASKFGKLSSGHRTGKGQSSFQSQRKAVPKHASKVMLKILQARLQQYVNQELQDVQAGFRKGRGTRDQDANICFVTEKAREFQKTSTYTSLTTLKPLTVWITKYCGKVLKSWEYQTNLPASWETCMQNKKQQLESDT